MTGLAHRGFSLHDYGKTLIHTLKDNGYLTVLSGMQHIAPHKPADAHEVIGYDKYLGTHHEAEIKAEEFLDSKPQSPFFLDTGFGETHRPFPSDCSPHDPRYTLPPSGLPDTPETRLDMAQFKKSAEILDAKIGRVLAALDRNGYRDNTIVICTTDHGIAFPGMKCNLEDAGTGVMLIMRGPGGFSGGRVLDSMTAHIDIFPTLCELLNIQAKHELHGESLLPLVRDGKDEVRNSLLLEINYHAAFEPVRAVRTKRYKYIRRYDKRNSPVLPNCDAGFSKTVRLDNGWASMAPDQEYLFDLIFDPCEKNNLANDSRHSNVLKEMRDLLDKEMKRTSDPLLSGDIQPPKTALLNPRNGIDPVSDEIMPEGQR